MMTTPANSGRGFSNPVEALRNPEVRQYFTALFRSDISPEDKYDTVIRFFELEIDLEKQLLTRQPNLESGRQEQISGAAVETAQNAEVWQPELILQQTEEGLRRALGRVGRSQHRDGGWGDKPEQSHPWATAWTVLLLHEAGKLGLDEGAGSISRGLEWLVENRARWSLDADEIRQGQGNSVFETAIALRCVKTTSAASRPAVRGSIERSIARLLDEQKDPGNWEPTYYRHDWNGAREVPWPDVGATSFAIQALAEAGSGADAVQAAGRAVRWLIGEQNEKGSWNGFIAEEHGSPAVPVPSVNKTCDALNGLLAGQRLGIDLAPYLVHIEKAVRWMREQEEAVVSHGRITGWAWKSEEKQTEKFNFLENTCLSLDTLLDMEPISEIISLPQLAASALWLLGQQLGADGGLAGDPDDGKWPNDDTGRIAFPILKFYSRITGASVFQLAPAAPAVPEHPGAARMAPDSAAAPQRQGTA
jgi:hypothetical protein